jgi:hypothetical protein
MNVARFRLSLARDPTRSPVPSGVTEEESLRCLAQLQAIEGAGLLALALAIGDYDLFARYAHEQGLTPRLLTVGAIPGRAAPVVV